MSYTVILPKSVQKQLDRLSPDINSRVIAALSALETNPRPAGAKKLKGRDAWRIRVGDYRVIYEIHDRALQVIVVQTGHRRDVYRDS
ncbi:MAG: type II toxin-antitoxin system RelE family toxin [Roseimicrobium sp.]